MTPTGDYKLRDQGQYVQHRVTGAPERRSRKQPAALATTATALGTYVSMPRPPNPDGQSEDDGEYRLGYFFLNPELF